MIDVFVLDCKVKFKILANEHTLRHYEGKLSLICVGESDESIAMVDLLGLTLHSLEQVILLLRNHFVGKKLLNLILRII